MEWFNIFLSENYENSIGQTFIDNDTTLYLSGSFRKNINLDIKNGSDNKILNNSNIHHFLAKWDKNKNLKWVKFIDPNTVSSQTKFEKIGFTLDNHKNIYQLGVYYNKLLLYDIDTQIVSKGFRSSYIVKFDSDGNRKLLKVLNNNTNFECLKKILYSNSSHLYIAGNIEDSFKFLSQDSRDSVKLYSKYKNFSFVCKLDTLGNIRWMKQFHSPFSAIVDYTIDSSENIILSGIYKDTIYSNPNSEKEFLVVNKKDNIFTFLVKINSNGEHIFSSNLNNTLYNSIVCDNSQNIYLSNYFNGKINLSPNVSVEALGKNRFDKLIIKLDSLGTYLWHKQFKKYRKFDYVSRQNQMSIDSFIVIGGNFDDELIFDSEIKLVSNDYKPYSYLSVLDKSGKLLSAIILKTNGEFTETRHVFQNKNGILWSGYVTGDTDFDPTKKEDVKKVNNHPAGFVVKLSFDSYNENDLDNGDSSNSSINSNIQESWSFYPNPIKSNLKIKFPNNSHNTNVKIYDILGKNVFSTIFEKTENVIDLNFLTKGVYYLELENEDYKQVSKIEKE
jgi:hypothetical protein